MLLKPANTNVGTHNECYNSIADIKPAKFCYMTNETWLAYNKALNINKQVFILNKAKKNLRMYARMKVFNTMAYNLTLRAYIHEIEIVTGQKIL